MIISDKHKLVFFHIPKTGGSSITKLLIEKYKGKPYYDKHCNVDWGMRLLGNRRNYFKFSIVRNPFSRMVSWYNHLVEERKADKEIIDPRNFYYFLEYYRKTKEHSKMEMFQYDQNQFDFLIPDKSNLNYIIKLESIDKQWKDICDIKKMRYYKVPHERKGIEIDYREYYDEKLVAYMQNIFRIDLEYFDYDFN